VQRRLQAKLTINTPGDVHEQEADRVAGEVLRMPEPALQRAGGEESPKSSGKESEDGKLQASPGEAPATAGDPAPEIVHQVLRSSGQPLDSSARGFMEPRFGQDFGGVRVHTDSHAAESAAAVGARAYTVGQDIVFGEGAFSPARRSGKELLAHELTHVVQQGGGGGAPLQKAQERE
jgi:hypothetical protein